MGPHPLCYNKCGALVVDAGLWRGSCASGLGLLLASELYVLISVRNWNDERGSFEGCGWFSTWTRTRAAHRGVGADRTIDRGAYKHTRRTLPRGWTGRLSPVPEPTGRDPAGDVPAAAVAATPVYRRTSSSCSSASSRDGSDIGA